MIKHEKQSKKQSKRCCNILAVLYMAYKVIIKKIYIFCFYVEAACFTTHYYNSICHLIIKTTHNLSYCRLVCMLLVIDAVYTHNIHF